MIEGALLFAILGCFAGLRLPLRVSAIGLPVALLVYSTVLALAGQGLGSILLGVVVALAASQVGMFVAVLIRVVEAQLSRTNAVGVGGRATRRAPGMLERT